MRDDENLRPSLERIEERLRAVEVQLGRLSAQIASEQLAIGRSLDQLRQVSESHARILVGQNGHSLTTRVAMLEDSEQTRKWSLRAIWSAVVAVVVKAIYDVIQVGR